MKKIIFVSLALLCSLGVRAQYVQSVEINPDARSAGMAKTTIAADATAFSVFDNVSAVAFSDFRFAASYAYAQELSKSNMHALGGYYRLNPKHGLALGFRYYNGGQYGSSQDGVIYTSIKPHDAIVDLGYSYSVNGFLSVGANLRYVNTMESDVAANAFGFDAGVYYRRNAFSAAFTVNNLGTKVDYGAGGDNMPASVNAGGSYRFNFARNHRLTGNLQLGYRFLPSSASYFGGGIGVEYTYNDMFSLRGGYRIGDRVRSLSLLGNHATLGCGVYIGPFAVDFAWILLSKSSEASSPSGNVWRISAGVRF